jgi:outer membrane protein assembly factor BamA
LRILKQTLLAYLYLFFSLVFSDGLFAQEITLEIASKQKIETIVLRKMDYQKQHKDKTSINLELSKISSYLKNKGYFTNTIDSIVNSGKTTKVYFSLNEKINKAVLKFSSDDHLNLNKLEIENSSFSIPIEQLEETLQTISKELGNDGKSFSTVQLKKIQLKDNTLFADLAIQPSKKRIINEVLLKGYESFPKSFIRHYFNIDKKTIFNQKKISTVAKMSKSLAFAKEIKPPEVLFTKDSTFLYIYLKKQQNNSFDGLVNFTSKEDGSVLFNGHIDLKLSNILNTGERFELFWNSIGKERQEFKLSAEIPYIFNSVISPEISFSIYKQDSTFLNTKFTSKLFYNLSAKSKLAITYSSETSENLQEQLTNGIATFDNYFMGFQFEYAIPKNDFFFNNKFYLAINPTYGQRLTETASSNQFKIETTASYIWQLSKRSSIFIKNTTGYLNSDTFIDNELFRIGGANSIRGFNEQSIFTNGYTFFNFEYRFLTSERAYFYSISDVGNIEATKNSGNLLAFGLGYLFTSKNSQINISSAVGKTNSQPFDFKEAKLIISWKSFF